MNKFKGLPHRQEIIYSGKKIICVNDSKATSFDACLQSLSSYNKIYWIVGGLPKERDSFNLKNVSKNITKAYIIGKKCSFFAKQLKNIIPISLSYNLRNAVDNIFRDLKKDNNIKSTILLSPAGASFDQFENFEDRGKHFKILIKKLIKRLSNV